MRSSEWARMIWSIKKRSSVNEIQCRISVFKKRSGGGGATEEERMSDKSTGRRSNNKPGPEEPGEAGSKDTCLNGAKSLRRGEHKNAPTIEQID
jgi:hypothetical protein